MVSRWQRNITPHRNYRQPVQVMAQEVRLLLPIPSCLLVFYLVQVAWDESLYASAGLVKCLPKAWGPYNSLMEGKQMMKVQLLPLVCPPLLESSWHPRSPSAPTRCWPHRQRKTCAPWWETIGPSCCASSSVLRWPIALLRPRTQRARQRHRDANRPRSFPAGRGLPPRVDDERRPAARRFPS